MFLLFTEENVDKNENKIFYFWDELTFKLPPLNIAHHFLLHFAFYHFLHLSFQVLWP